MENTLHWLERRGIYVLAVIAVIGLVISTILGSLDPNPLGFDIEPDDRPFVYDLSLAYIAGVIFHFLVVHIPERRKTKALMGALRSPFMIISNNGKALMTELATIAECPKQETLTREHVLKVLTALNDNGYVESFIRWRLSISERAYQDLTPYISSLPIDLQVALRRENSELQALLPKPSQHVGARHHSLANLRREFLLPTDDGTKTRVTLAYREIDFWTYIASCEGLREEVERHPYTVVRNAMGALDPEGEVTSWSDTIGVEHTEYPPTATSNKPLDSFS